MPSRGGREQSRLRGNDYDEMTLQDGIKMGVLVGGSPHMYNT